MRWRREVEDSNTCIEALLQHVASSLSKEHRRLRYIGDIINLTAQTWVSRVDHGVLEAFFANTGKRARWTWRQVCFLLFVKSSLSRSRLERPSGLSDGSHVARRAANAVTWERSKISLISEERMVLLVTFITFFHIQFHPCVVSNATSGIYGWNWVCSVQYQRSVCLADHGYSFEHVDSRYSGRSVLGKAYQNYWSDQCSKSINLLSTNLPQTIGSYFSKQLERIECTAFRIAVHCFEKGASRNAHHCQ